MWRMSKKIRKEMERRILKPFRKVREWDYPSSNCVNSKNDSQLRRRNSKFLSRKKMLAKMQPLKKLKRTIERVKGRNKKLKLTNNIESNSKLKRSSYSPTPDFLEKMKIMF
jgi:hypothetical protein